MEASGRALSPVPSPPFLVYRHPSSVSPPQPGDTEWDFEVEVAATGEQEVLPRSDLTNIDADEETWEALRIE